MASRLGVAAALVAAAPQWVAGAAGTTEWYLGYGGGTCTDTCQAFGKTCVPAPLPSNIIEMQSTVIQAHVACANIQKVTASSMENFAPAFQPPTGNGHNGICWYPKEITHQHCNVAPTQSQVAAERMMMRFCACSEVEGIQWLLGQPAQNCDAVCASRGGMCDHVGSSIWPTDVQSMKEAAHSAGQACQSHEFGVSDAAPNLAGGVCHWSKNRGAGQTPSCTTSEEGVQRFCPCYAVSQNHAI